MTTIIGNVHTRCLVDIPIVLPCWSSKPAVFLRPECLEKIPVPPVPHTSWTCCCHISRNRRRRSARCLQGSLCWCRWHRRWSLHLLCILKLHHYKNRACVKENSLLHILAQIFWATIILPKHFLSRPIPQNLWWGFFSHRPQIMVFMDQKFTNDLFRRFTPDLVLFISVNKHRFYFFPIHHCKNSHSSLHISVHHWKIVYRKMV